VVLTGGRDCLVQHARRVLRVAGGGQAIEKQAVLRQDQASRCWLLFAARFGRDRVTPRNRDQTHDEARYYKQTDGSEHLVPPEAIQMGLNQYTWINRKKKGRNVRGPDLCGAKLLGPRTS